MFTGLIEEVGKVKDIKMNNTSGIIRIQAKKVLEGSKLGDSIAVNGVCLTVTDISGDTFSADVMAETFRRSSLGELSKGSGVNLERAMSAEGRFGGHIVSGHIDGTGHISNIKKESNAVWYTISAEEKILNYVVEKGSIAIDGISLTVAYIDNECFKVSVIPHTEEVTILGEKSKGSVVNLECDIIGKYVEKMLLSGCESIYAPKKKKDSKITLEFLKENGF